MAPDPQVSHYEPHFYLCTSQPGLASGDGGNAPLHFSHTMALSTKDTPRSDLADLGTPSRTLQLGGSPRQLPKAGQEGNWISTAPVRPTGPQQHQHHLGSRLKCRSAGRITVHRQEEALCSNSARLNLRIVGADPAHPWSCFPAGESLRPTPP